MNVDELMEDYTEDSVIFGNMGTFKGLEGVRQCMQGFVDEFKADAEFVMGEKIVEGNVAYITWTAETALNSYKFATDTMVILNDKIVSQTIGVLAQKKE